LAAFITILSSLLVGVVLAVAPWTAWWDSNGLIALWPAARAAATSAWTRGAVTGLGLVNLLLAVRDVHARLSGDESGE